MAEWRCTFGSVVLAAVITCLAATPAVMAQNAGGESLPSAQELERKPRDYANLGYCLTQYEVEHFSEILDLSPEQHEIMMSMFTELRRRVFEAEMPLQQSRDDFLEFARTMFDGDREQVERNRARFREWQKELWAQAEPFNAFQKQVVQEFFDDLELLLEPEQAERLDGAIRWRHRFRLLRWGMIPYSDFSVAEVVRSMDLRVDPERFDGSDRPSLESICDEYEIELDRLLVRRAEEEQRFAPGPRGLGGSPSGTRAIDSAEDKEKWREAVGEVNLRLVSMQKKYIRRIVNLLEPGAAAEFQRRCYEKAYRHILADDSTEDQFSRLLEDPALSDEQRSYVERMRAEYQAAKAPIDARWIRALDEFVSKGGARLAGAEVPVALGDPFNETDDADGMFDLANEQMALRDQCRERIAELRVEFGLDEPEEGNED